MPDLRDLNLLHPLPRPKYSHTISVFKAMRNQRFRNACHQAATRQQAAVAHRMSAMSQPPEKM
jgi:hypothetical protein